MEVVTQNEKDLMDGNETGALLHSKQKSVVLAKETNPQLNSNHFCNGAADMSQICNGAEPVCEWSDGEEECLEETERLLRQHSGCGGPWRLFRSPVEGRGLVAARALSAGELVLRDPPLVLAPRANAATNGSRPQCARCLRMRPQHLLALCPAGCGMAVCHPAHDDCTPGGHEGECALLLAWGVRDGGGASAPAHAHAQQQAVLSRASAAVRCLALPEARRRLVGRLYAHSHPRHGWEIDAFTCGCSLLVLHITMGELN